MSKQAKKRKRIYDFFGLHQVLTSTPWLGYKGCFRKKKITNTTSHPNISSLKTAIKEEWNKMSEEFILKACK